MLLEIGVGLFMIGNFVYHRYIEEKPETQRPADVSLPRVDVGAPVPLIYGRCRVRAPILAWSGNYSVPGDEDPYYHADFLFIVGIPFNGGIGLIGDQVGSSGSTGGVYAGDVMLPTLMTNFPGHPGVRSWVSTQSGDPASLHIAGVLYDGRTTQDANDDVAGAFRSIHDAMVTAGHASSTIPGYRQQIVAFGRYSLGISPSVPSFGFEVIARSTGSASDLGVSGWAGIDDADPAAVIFDILTSPFGKLRLPISMIDKPSFAQASATLLTEQVTVPHGYSLSIEQLTDGEAIIKDVLRHIDGMIYQDPATGLVVLRLVRAPGVDDVFDDINPTNMLTPGSGWYVVQGWAEEPNQVRVRYIDRNQNYNTSSVMAQNQAAIQANQGRPRTLELEFLGCSNAAYASYLAARELAVVSRPLAKATVRVTRAFAKHRIGDIVTLTWPQLNIVKMQMRIVRMNFGKPGDSAITLDLIRDVFDQRLGAFPLP